MEPGTALLTLIALGFYLALVFIVPTRMARQRGRSAFRWLLISIFVSPILAIVLLFLCGNAPRAAQA